MKTFLIDDDELSIFFTKHLLMLEKATQDITTFLCGEEALNALTSSCEEDWPDTIFLDLNMPLMDGWEFLEALAPIAHQLSKRSKIYILTSSLAELDRVKMKKYPFVAGLMNKPLRKEDIQLVVAQHKSNPDTH